MKRKHHPAKLAAELLFAGLLVLTALNYQYILDEYARATYKTTPEVAQIESRLGLTEAARGIFYRADPGLDNKSTFNTNCETSRGELELGCFYRNRIHVLQIENPSLAPEMDVVMAHELLHAVWVRLSTNERKLLGQELQRVSAGLSDSELRERMAGYARSEPGQENNELHSILATEYSQLTPALEAHYRRFFRDRSLIVAAHQSYEGVFSSRKQELERELATIRSLKARLNVINQQLQQRQAAGEIAQYNALVPAQNRLVDDINRRIEVYRRGVEEYNALSRSLDSQEITDTETGVK